MQRQDSMWPEVETEICRVQFQAKCNAVVLSPTSDWLFIRLSALSNFFANTCAARGCGVVSLQIGPIESKPLRFCHKCTKYSVFLIFFGANLQ